MITLNLQIALNSRSLTKKFHLSLSLSLNMALNLALLDLSLYLFLYMALNLALSMRPSMADLVSLKKSETTIKSWKGHVVPPTTTLDEVLTGVQVVQPIVISNPKKVKRKDFPADFKFGCSTSALQVFLSLSHSLSIL